MNQVIFVQFNASNDIEIPFILNVDDKHELFYQGFKTYNHYYFLYI